MGKKNIVMVSDKPDTVGVCFGSLFCIPGVCMCIAVSDFGISVLLLAHFSTCRLFFYFLCTMQKNDAYSLLKPNNSIA